MATTLKSLSSFVLLLIVNSLFFIGTTEARPFNIMKSGNSAASRGTESFFDGLSLGGIKEGPSPGAGHGFTNSGTLGGIKEGPSPGVGHAFTNSGTLGGMKEGPSPGVGHAFTNSGTLGGIKEGPSPCCGNKYTTGIKH